MPGSSANFDKATIRLLSTKSNKISSVLMDKETMRCGLASKCKVTPCASVTVYPCVDVSAFSLFCLQPVGNNSITKITSILKSTYIYVLSLYFFINHFTSKLIAVAKLQLPLYEFIHCLIIRNSFDKSFLAAKS